MSPSAVPGTSRLVGRPVIWDADHEPSSPPAGPHFAERVGRLSRGLRATGLASGQPVVILCCREHAEDRAVAVKAVELTGGRPVVPADWSEGALSSLFSDRGHGAIHLACEEGVEAWRSVRGTGVMIGDGVGVLWWRALECRHAGGPARVDPQGPACTPQ